MGVAQAPADAPVVVACPEKIPVDGYKLRIFDDTVEVCFYQNTWAVNGLQAELSVVCIVVARGVYEHWLREAAPRCMEALMTVPIQHSVQ